LLSGIHASRSRDPGDGFRIAQIIVVTMICLSGMTAVKMNVDAFYRPSAILR